MPYGDGTGPMWARGRWMCRRGMGRGAGYGSGMGSCIQNKPGDEVSELTAYAEGLKRELKEVEEEIEKMKKTE